MSLSIHIPKQIAYKKAAGLLISEFIESKDKEKKNKEKNKADDLIKWRMPKEHVGFLKYRKNDPL